MDIYSVTRNSLVCLSLCQQKVDERAVVKVPVRGISTGKLGSYPNLNSDRSVMLMSARRTTAIQLLLDLARDLVVSLSRATVPVKVRESAHEQEMGGWT